MGTKVFCVFQTFLNFPQNSEYFEYRHIGGKKNTPSRRAKIFSAPTLSPKISHWRKTGSKTLEVGLGGGGRGGLEFEQAAPL